MTAPCEVAVKSVIPAIRAYIAKQLIQAHNMKQTEVADILGITQTAVSKYVSNVRGQALRIYQEDEIQSMMNKIASRIAGKKTSGIQLMLEFCAVCKAVRRNGQMCKLCERSNPEIRSASCNVCM